MKTDKELIEEFLNKGGAVEKLEKIEQEQGLTVTKAKPQPGMEIKTLKEGELLYTKKQKRKKKIDPLSKIKTELLPENIKRLLEL